MGHGRSGTHIGKLVAKKLTRDATANTHGRRFKLSPVQQRIYGPGRRAVRQRSSKHCSRDGIAGNLYRRVVKSGGGPGDDRRVQTGREIQKARQQKQSTEGQHSGQSVKEVYTPREVWSTSLYLLRKRLPRQRQTLSEKTRQDKEEVWGYRGGHSRRHKRLGQPTRVDSQRRRIIPRFEF